MQAKRYTFPKCERLLKPADFQVVFTQQQKIFYQGLVMYYRHNALEYPRLGIVVGKKILKKAVLRNRFKRIVRESFRLNHKELNSNDLMVVATKQLTEGTLCRAPQILAQLWLRLAEKSSSS